MALTKEEKNLRRRYARYAEKGLRHLRSINVKIPTIKAVNFNMRNYGPLTRVKCGCVLHHVCIDNELSEKLPNQLHDYACSRFKEIMKYIGFDENYEQDEKSYTFGFYVSMKDANQFGLSESYEHLTHVWKNVLRKEGLLID